MILGTGTAAGAATMRRPCPRMIWAPCLSKMPGQRLPRLHSCRPDRRPITAGRGPASAGFFYGEWAAGFEPAQMQSAVLRSTSCPFFRLGHSQGITAKITGQVFATELQPNCYGSITKTADDGTPMAFSSLSFAPAFVTPSSRRHADCYLIVLLCVACPTTPRPPLIFAPPGPLQSPGHDFPGFCDRWHATRTTRCLELRQEGAWLERAGTASETRTFTILTGTRGPVRLDLPNVGIGMCLRRKNFSCRSFFLSRARAWASRFITCSRVLPSPQAKAGRAEPYTRAHKGRHADRFCPEPRRSTRTALRYGVPGLSWCQIRQAHIPIPPIVSSLQRRIAVRPSYATGIKHSTSRTT